MIQKILGSLSLQIQWNIHQSDRYFFLTGILGMFTVHGIKKWKTNIKILKGKITLNTLNWDENQSNVCRKKYVGKASEK